MGLPRRRGRGPARTYVVAGAPATGKSVFGSHLSRCLGAALLDQDVLTGPLTSVVTDLVGAAPGDLDDPRVRSATRRATYEALVDTAARCLASGVPVVLVAPFTAERSDPGAWSRLERRLGAPGGVVLVWTTCPPAEVARRLAARGAPRDRRKLADLTGFLTSGVLDPPAVPHVALDTTTPAAEQITSVLAATPAEPLAGRLTSMSEAPAERRHGEEDRCS
jgi:predicted kinase